MWWSNPQNLNKKTMRTIVMMLCLTILGGTMNFATAQNKTKEKPSAEEMATKRTEKLTEVLGLTKSQKDQVYNLMLSQAKDKEKVNNTKLTQDERREAMKELHQAFDAKFKGLLTAEQLTKYEAHKAEMKNKKKGHGNQGCPHGGGNCPHGGH